MLHFQLFNYMIPCRITFRSYRWRISIRPNWWDTRQFEIFFEWYSRKEYSKKIHRIRGILTLGRNDKGIPGNTSRKASYWNLLRNNPIDQDAQWRLYPYDFALLDKYDLFCYSMLGNEELVILNYWAQEFLYNLSDTIKAFSILLVEAFSLDGTQANSISLNNFKLAATILSTNKSINTTFTNNTL